MHIGLDFDNTLINYDILFKRVALEQGLIPDNIEEHKNAVRNYLRESNKEDAWTRLQGEVYGNRILEAEPYKGMCESLQSIAKFNIPMTIISHKTRIPYLGEPWDLHLAARSWLKKIKIDSPTGPNICNKRIFFEISKEDKCNRIIASGCTHYIDDLPEILAMLPDNITKIHFTPNSKSFNNKNWLSMQSWGELLTLLDLHV
jgi:hypothetical protein